MAAPRNIQRVSRPTRQQHSSMRWANALENVRYSISGAASDPSSEVLINLTVASISFGSLTFPRETSHLTALFDTLLGMSPPFPFILALDPRMMILASDIEARLEERMRQGLALLIKWAPQQTILQHEASDSSRRNVACCTEGPGVAVRLPALSSRTVDPEACMKQL